ncbi:MAG: condensation domain-containing protein, partial [Cellulomonas sp.]|nr:condensation domain-containing protein [Cellulomonas sp.]
MTSAMASLADLTPQQRRRAAERLRTRSGAPAGGLRVRPQERPDGLAALSSTQERMWFLEQFQPGSAMHVMSGAVRLPAVIPPQVFAECLDEMVARHEVLRTRFEERAGAPVGVVEAEVRVPLRYLDGVAEAAMWQAFEADARTPFRVAAEPLVRATLATTDDGRCYVQVTMHHLVSDGFSTGILFSELGALCVPRLLGQRADLPPVPFQYADYAQWLAETGSSEQTAAAVEYWRDALVDAPQVLALPEDLPRPDRFTYRGERLDFELDAELSGQVRAYAAAQETTPFAVFLAAYAVVLSRWAADDTVVVGAPSAQRSEVGADRVVGPFLNTLALCVSLEGAPSLREAVARAGRVTRAGFAHQALPFERVLRELQVARDPSRSPLVQAVLNVQHAPSGQLELRDLHNGCAQFDLLVALVLTSGATTGHVDFASDVFDRRTVAAMVAAFRRVLESVVDDDTVTVDRVPLTPSDDVDPPASDCPTRQVAVVRQKAPTLHNAVLAIADRWPDRCAITQGSEHLSFGDLAERVAALAARLCSVDPGSATPVGLVLPRSVDTVVAMVAASLVGRP